MNSLFFQKYLNLTLLAILGHIQSTASAPVLSANRISLYNSTDKVIVLDKQNFLSTVYHSDTAWLIEFYASWCGHCQSYANVYLILLFFLQILIFLIFRFIEKLVSIHGVNKHI